MNSLTTAAEVIAAAWDTAIFESEDEQGALFYFDPPDAGDRDFATRYGIRLGRTTGAQLIHLPPDLE